MFTHRLFNLFVAIALVAVIALTAQAAFSQMNSNYRESEELTPLDSRFSERYGEAVPEDLLAQVAAAKRPAREYRLREGQ